LKGSARPRYRAPTRSTARAVESLRMSWSLCGPVGSRNRPGVLVELKAPRARTEWSCHPDTRGGARDVPDAIAVILAEAVAGLSFVDTGRAVGSGLGSESARVTALVRAVIAAEAVVATFRYASRGPDCCCRFRHRHAHQDADRAAPDRPFLHGS
jgi:hypothetical protein